MLSKISNCLEALDSAVDWVYLTEAAKLKALTR